MAVEDRECLFSPGNDQENIQTFKAVAVQKIVATNKAKRVNHTKLKCLLTRHATVNIRQRRNNEQKKGKDALAHTVVCKRLLKSQCSDFMFKRDSLLCGNV